MKKKHLLTALLLLFYYLPVNAQSFAINTDGSTANTSAILDVKSITKGVLIPRMVLADRNLIATPATGLMIYQTDNNPGFYYYDGSVWLSVTSSGNNLWIQNGNDIYNTNTANVGIGTNAPNASALLHINTGTSTTKGLLLTGTYNAASTVPDLGAGSRMMFYPGKAAFRAGYVNGTQWNNVNVGDYSFSSGVNTRASGFYSTAMGLATTASGNYSTAMGINTIASGFYSTAMGLSTTASSLASVAMGENATASGEYSTAMGRATTSSGNYSTAMGFNTTAFGSYSIAMGFNTTAFGYASVAMGDITTASGTGSVAMGFNTIASGNNSIAMGYSTRASGGSSTAIGLATTASGNYSTAMGTTTISSGDNSTAMGYQNISSGGASFAMGGFATSSGNYSSSLGAGVKSKSLGGFVTGLYNDSTNAASGTSVNSLNRIFQVGNGTADNARSNAMTVLQNGNVGIGVTDPQQMLSVFKGMNIDQDDSNNGTPVNSLRFGSGSGEAIGSKRTAGGNNWGLDFYTNNINRMTITNGGTVQVANNLTVQSGKGIIRNTDGTQSKKLSASVTVNTSFLAGETKLFAVTWPEAFGAGPEAFVGNVTGGTGGWAEVVMTLANTNTTGATLYVYNPRTVTASANFTIKVIAIGAQ